MSIADLVRVEYRMTALHFKTLGRIALRYDLHESVIYDLNATLSRPYRNELRAILKHGEKTIYSYS